MRILALAAGGILLAASPALYQALAYADPPAPAAKPKQPQRKPKEIALPPAEAYLFAVALHGVKLPGNPAGKLEDSKQPYVITASSISCHETDMALDPGMYCEFSQRGVERRITDLPAWAISRMLERAGVKWDNGAGNARMRTSAVKCILKLGSGQSDDDDRDVSCVIQKARDSE